MYKNYEIIKQEELKDISSKGTLLKHIKSGAKIVLVENDDNNKVFSISFRTPPFDDTGVPHIIEHSVLCGSRKYPVKEPFVELMKGSLNTFLNAMTFADKTMYPIASCNDKDFNNLIDVYMDAALYPNILTKKEIFMQEGWHYELDDKDAPLTYNGVVYNEMKGVFSSVDSIVGRSAGASLFPDTPYGTESGGDPNYIPKLTYENFVAFYKKYYHPSNSYIYIYGNCNMEEKLEFLDKEYLSKFDTIDPNSEITLQKPFDSKKELELFYPIAKDQDIKNKTYFSYNIALTNPTKEEKYAIDIINTVLLTANGACLERALLDAKIGTVIEGSFDTEILQPVFSIVCKNCNEKNKDKFVNIIESEFKKYVKEGLDKKAIEAALNSYEFKLREADFGGFPKGLIYNMTMLTSWLYDDNDPFSPVCFDLEFKSLREKINTDYFEKIIEKFFILNNHKTLTCVKPSKTIQTEKENKIKKELEIYKNSLTDEEILKIIEETKALHEYQKAPDTKEGLDTIPTLKKEDLSLDVFKISNIEHQINGVKVLHHDYNTNGIAYIRAFFDANNINNELIPYLGIYQTLMFKLDTNKHTYLTLDQDININTGGISANLSDTPSTDGEKVYFVLSAATLYNKIEYCFDIFDEVINYTNFDMKQRVFELLQVEYQTLMQRFTYSGHQAALKRALSYINKSSYIYENYNGIAYYDVISRIVKNFDEEYPILLKNLELIKSLIISKDLIVNVTCDEIGYNESINAINTFTNKLTEKKDLTRSIEFKEDKKNEGFKTTFDVNYCALVGDYTKAGLKYNGSINVFTNILSTDYLWKNVRVLGGAYGCMMDINKYGQSYFVSYRDPKIKETYNTYNEIIKYIDDFNVNEEELLKYIIGAVGAFDYPKSSSVLGSYSFYKYLEGITEEDLLKEKKEIINTKLSDIKAMKEYITEIIKQNVVCTVGNEKIVEDNKDLFKETKPLFK